MLEFDPLIGYLERLTQFAPPPQRDLGRVPTLSSLATFRCTALNWQRIIGLAEITLCVRHSQASQLNY
jgi:hypothetical protein